VFDPRAQMGHHMRLTVLGCHAGIPADGRAGSGYLVSTAATNLLLDCGPGIATALSARLQPRELTGVVISHFHLDHSYDLLPLGKMLLPDHFAGGEPLASRPSATPLYVPAGGRALLARLAAIFPVGTLPTLDLAFELAFDVREYRPGDDFAIGDFRITMHGLVHTAPNCGSRIESTGGRLAYTGDTAMTDRLPALARDADIFLAEATLAAPDGGLRGHLTATDAGRVAAMSGVRRLVLTHFSSTAPEWLRARRADAERVFAGPVHLAAPGEWFDARP
jgi:ribonuclease BN (tRNA processing enzyme)